VHGADDATVRVESPNSGVIVTRTEGGVQFRATDGAVIGLTFTAETSTIPIAPLELLRPGEIVESMDLRAVVIPAGPASKARTDRLAGLGFEKSFENDRYLVLTREAPR
jgi:hypothetical protein